MGMGGFLPKSQDTKKPKLKKIRITSLLVFLVVSGGGGWEVCVCVCGVVISSVVVGRCGLSVLGVRLGVRRVELRRRRVELATAHRRAAAGRQVVRGRVLLLLLEVERARPAQRRVARDAAARLLLRGARRVRRRGGRGRSRGLGGGGGGGGDRGLNEDLCDAAAVLHGVRLVAVVRRGDGGGSDAATAQRQRVEAAEAGAERGVEHGAAALEREGLAPAQEAGVVVARQGGGGALEGAVRVLGGPVQEGGGGELAGREAGEGRGVRGHRRSDRGGHEGCRFGDDDRSVVLRAVVHRLPARLPFSVAFGTVGVAAGAVVGVGVVAAAAVAVVVVAAVVVVVAAAAVVAA
eukprot:Rhum_TRINITY_DN14631_c0_g2::Rhum_TRINITY_DN14631_c0_g2_i1::g.104980::m.104980